MAGYAARNRFTRGRLIFLCVWLAIFAIAFLLWTYVLGKVGKALEEYESVQPKYAAEDIFNGYFANAAASAIVAYDEYDISEYDKDGAVLEYLASVIDGKSLTYSPVISSDSAVKTYAVAADGVRFASFTLVESEDMTDILGMSKWRLGEIDVKISPMFGVSIYAPKNAIVRVNGVALTDEYREGDLIELEEAVYFSESDPEARLMANYYIDGLFAVPEVTVASLDGSVSYGLEYDKENSSYNAEYAYRLVLADAYNQRLLEEERMKREEEERLKREEEERLKREEEERLAAEAERQRISDEIEAVYGDRICEAMTAYAKYTHVSNEENNRTAWDLLAYFKSGTPIYYFIKDYYNYSDYIPDAYEYHGIDMHHFAWSDESKTSFICIFEMDLIMTVNMGKTNESRVTERFCLEVHVETSNNKALISELINSDG